jgi:hypothetical protein
VAIIVGAVTAAFGVVGYVVITLATWNVGE